MSFIQLMEKQLIEIQFFSRKLRKSVSKAPKTFLMTETDVSRWPVVFLLLVLVKCVYRIQT